MAVTLSLRGEIDLANAEEFRQEVEGALRDDADLMVDCSELTFIDSMGIGVLWRARARLSATGHRVYLLKVNDKVRPALDAVGLLNP
ncbi:MAG TPA: STAS domain-containing protein [Acidimicrobiia bacterium]|jgi:stage II sporulation protein AA (anti-sigma F factor antagonist)